MLFELDVHIKCPMCGRIMVHHHFKNEKFETASCLTPGCVYRDLHFKLPTIELEPTDASKQILEEIKIINKGW